jgi:zinc transport system substrate-binding protein
MIACPAMKLRIVPILGSWHPRRSRNPCLSLLSITVTLIVMAMGVSACSGGNQSDGDGKLEVVAGFYPLAEAAAKVGGALVAVRNLTPPGVEPHDLELTPDEIADIQSADVVLYLGGGFAPAVEQGVSDAQGIVVDLLEGMSLRPGVPDEEGPVSDPHVWLDPVLYRQMVDRTAQALSEAMPEDASAFESNARAFQAELDGLDEEYRSGLTDCERDVIVTSHAAFGYVSTRYGLTQEAIAGLSPEAEPSPERLAHLAQLVRREGVTTIFTEELVSPKVAETLASEVGVSTAVLNPLEGLTEEELSAGQDYVSVMRSNLSTLEEALGCPAG